MQSVRCDACGKRALVAASQCPHCGHLFEYRDSFGELLPLAHCPSCDSDYPRSRGACRWCGTAPRRVRLAPHVWRVAGGTAFVLMGVGVWLTRPVSAPGAMPRPFAAVSEASPAPLRPTDTAVALQPRDSVVGETLPAPAVAVAMESPGDVPAPLPQSTGDQPSPLPPDVPPEAAPAAAVAATPIRRLPRVRSAVVRTAAPRRPTRWVRVVTRDWTPVRARANGKSRILASIGPDTRVEVTSATDSWIRLRTRGLSGWVERRHVFRR